jgi:hypothetical protein
LKCGIPAAVPDLPSWVLVTDPMRALLGAVLDGTRNDPAAGGGGGVGSGVGGGSSRSDGGGGAHEMQSKHQVGFVGMGGIGKTLVSTWICRQKEVREAFDARCAF